jgi:DNA polymerase (family X)
MSLPLATAEKIAAKIVYELSPFCDQIEVAGSIRRRRPNVNDIDLVVLPKPPHAQALRERCKKNAIRVQTDGEMTLVVYLPYRPACPARPYPRPLEQELQLDVWIATPAGQDMFAPTPTNFGSLLLCRTGSAQHNIMLVGRAKSLGLRWNPYHGVFDGHGRCLAVATEQEIFTALQMDFIPPEDREA